MSYHGAIYVACTYNGSAGNVCNPGAGGQDCPVCVAALNTFLADLAADPAYSLVASFSQVDPSPGFLPEFNQATTGVTFRVNGTDYVGVKANATDTPLQYQANPFFPQVSINAYWYVQFQVLSAAPPNPPYPGNLVNTAPPQQTTFNRAPLNWPRYSCERHIKLGM